MADLLPVPEWVETDDPSDPCGLCVQWFTPEQWAGIPEPEGFDGFYPDGTDENERMAPYLPTGPVARLYRGFHARCEAIVAQYQAENAGDPT